MAVSVNTFHWCAAILDTEDEKTEELVTEEQEMMSVMGFTDFVSTKVGILWLVI